MEVTAPPWKTHAVLMLLKDEPGIITSKEKFPGCIYFPHTTAAKYETNLCSSKGERMVERGRRNNQTGKNNFMHLTRNCEVIPMCHKCGRRLSKGLTPKFHDELAAAPLESTGDRFGPTLSIDSSATQSMQTYQHSRNIPAYKPVTKKKKKK